MCKEIEQFLTMCELIVINEGTLKALIFAGTNFRENLFSREQIFANFANFEKNREIRENLFSRNILKIKNSRNFPQKLAFTWFYRKVTTV